MADAHSIRLKRRRWELTGQRFLKLVALSKVATPGRARWLCRCDCGVEKVIAADKLLNGDTQTCGCGRRARIGAFAKVHARKHGLSVDHPMAFRIWMGMMKRCHDPENRAFKWYGARGITVCDRWRDPAQFVADMGDPEPGASIERVDNDGPYSPENCRWIPRVQQTHNQRSNRLLTHDGVTLHLSGWAARVGLEATTLQRRLARGWTVARALSTPVRQGNFRRA